MNKINLYGASGHAKVVIDIVKTRADVEIAYVFDDDSTVKTLSGYPVLSPSVHRKELSQYPLLISIGSNPVREHLVQRLVISQFSRALMHTSAQISEDIKIMEGSVVMPQAVINTSTRIGRHSIINSSAVVEHDCSLGDFVHVSPKACICGNVTIGDATHIGAGAVVLPNLRIGKNCVIGAGAVVIKDLPNYAKVVGNPARSI